MAHCSSMLVTALPSTLSEAQAENASLRLELSSLTEQQSEVEALQRNQSELAGTFEQWALEINEPEGARSASCSSRTSRMAARARLGDGCDVASRMGALAIADAPALPRHGSGCDRSHGGDTTATPPPLLSALPFSLPPAEDSWHSAVCETVRLRLMLHAAYPPERRNELAVRRQQLFDASSLLATCGFFRRFEGRGLALVLTDGAGAILHVNDAWECLCGYSLAEVRGHTCHFLQGPKTDADAIASVNARVACGEGSHARVLNYKKDGAVFENSVEVVPIFDGDDMCSSKGCRMRPSHFIARLVEIESDVCPPP